MHNYIKSYSVFIKYCKYILLFIAILLFLSIFTFNKKDALRSGRILISADLIDLAADQKITNPQFSGSTTSGDLFFLNATHAKTSSPKPENIDFNNPSLEFEVMNGIGFKIRSKNGFVDFVNHSAHLLDDVVIDMTNGYIMFSEEIRFDHKLGNLSIPGSVYASGPSGRIIAGSMELLNYNNMNIRQKNGNLRFSNGVRMLYIPSTMK